MVAAVRLHLRLFQGLFDGHAARRATSNGHPLSQSASNDIISENHDQNDLNNCQAISPNAVATFASARFRCLINGDSRTGPHWCGMRIRTQSQGFLVLTICCGGQRDCGGRHRVT